MHHRNSERLANYCRAVRSTIFRLDGRVSLEVYQTAVERSLTCFFRVTIGLDSALHTERPEGMVTLTAVTMRAIMAEDALLDLMAYRPAALYVAWVLGKRQQRADLRLAAISCLDASGRLAMMLLDFYTRLRRKELVTGSTYNLPLTQVQIGNYLGLTVVYINRVLRSLREAGIVNLEKHCVTILDLERLTRLAVTEE